MQVEKKLPQRRKKITLKAYIDKVGVKPLAQKLRISPYSVWHWRRGYVLPSHDLMHKILRQAGPCLSYLDIVDHYYSPQNRKARRK